MDQGERTVAGRRGLRSRSRSSMPRAWRHFTALFITPSTRVTLCSCPGRRRRASGRSIKLLNIFGIAPNLTPPATPDPHSVDPINFASPEQIQTGKVDFRSQMYSLGATLWFLLTGSAPLEGAASLNEATQVPLAVRQLLRQMLAADPSERPLDPLALQNGITETLDNMHRRDAVAGKLGLPLAAEATVNPDQPRPIRPLTWKPLALAALLIGLAAVAAVTVAQYSRSRQAIGVPVGVPENVAETGAKTVEPAQSSPPVTAATPTTEVAQATAAPVLTSTTDAEPSRDRGKRAGYASRRFEPDVRE